MPRKRKFKKTKLNSSNNKVKEIKNEKSEESGITKIKKLIEKLKINGEIVKEDNKIKIIVGSLSDAFKLYRHGFYDVEIDENRSLIKRKK